MKTTCWLDGAACWAGEMEHLPAEGARLLVPGAGPLVVAEHWHAPECSTRPGWHIVLRRPSTPAEGTPPWERSEGAED